MFRRGKLELTPICQICHMNFQDTTRMLRHMNKAHSKPRRDRSI